MTDIVERLRGACNEWPAETLTVDLLSEAADTIVRLRDMLDSLMAPGGAARVGPSFAEMTKDFPRAPKDLCGND